MTSVLLRMPDSSCEVEMACTTEWFTLQTQLYTYRGGSQAFLLHRLALSDGQKGPMLLLTPREGGRSGPRR